MSVNNDDIWLYACIWLLCETFSGTVYSLLYGFWSSENKCLCLVLPITSFQQWLFIFQMKVTLSSQVFPVVKFLSSIDWRIIILAFPHPFDLLYCMFREYCQWLINKWPELFFIHSFSSVNSFWRYLWKEKHRKNIWVKHVIMLIRIVWVWFTPWWVFVKMTMRECDEWWNVLKDFHLLSSFFHNFLFILKVFPLFFPLSL